MATNVVIYFQVPCGWKSIKERHWTVLGRKENNDEEEGVLVISRKTNYGSVSMNWNVKYFCFFLTRPWYFATRKLCIETWIYHKRPSFLRHTTLRPISNLSGNYRFAINFGRMQREKCWKSPCQWIGKILWFSSLSVLLWSNYFPIKIAMVTAKWVETGEWIDLLTGWFVG